MSDPIANASAAELLRREFDLPRGSLTEAELLDWLAARVAELLRLRPDYLMSLCYTLDLPEEEVQAALHPATPEGPHHALARVLYLRQCQRVHTRQSVPAPPLSDPNAW